MQLTDTHLYSCKRIGKQTSLQTKTRTRWSCILFSACCLSSFCDVALVVRSRILSSNLGPISSLMIIHLWKPLPALPTLKKNGISTWWHIIWLRALQQHFCYASAAPLEYQIGIQLPRPPTVEILQISDIFESIALSSSSSYICAKLLKCW